MIRRLHFLALAFAVAFLCPLSQAMADQGDHIDITSPAAGAVMQGPLTLSGTYYSAGNNRYVLVTVWTYDPSTGIGQQVGQIQQFGPFNRGAGTYSTISEICLQGITMPRRL